LAPRRRDSALGGGGGGEPRLGTIVKLAGALETTPAELCAGIGWLPRSGRFQIKR